MANESETLRLLITGDSDGAVQAFKKARDSADRDLGKAEDRAEKTSAQLTKMGAASLAAGAVMAGALASTIGPASDLNEAINVAGLTFGESADEIEAWGETAAKSMGQSKRAALEGAAAIGGLLNNVGFLEEESASLSMELVQLASDMGSAFNTDPAEALEALRSGLAGQSEPLRKYNVFLSDAAIKAKAVEEGIWDGVGAMSEQEKTLARLRIITEQTSAIQGDFANTADGAANAQRVFNAELEDFRASVGQAALPIFQELLGFLNGLVGAFNGLPGPVQDAVGQIALATTGLLLLGGAAMTAAARIKPLVDALSRYTGGTKRAVAAGGLMTAAVVLAGEAWSRHNERVQEAERRIEGMKGALEGAMGPQDAALRWLQDYATENDKFRDILSGLTHAEMREFAASIAGQGDLSEETRRKIGDLAGSHVVLNVELQQVTAEFAKASAEIEKEGQIAETAAGQNAEAVRIYGEMAEGMRNAAGASENLGGKIERMRPPTKDLADVLADVNSELAEFFGAVQSAEEVEAEFQKALDDASKSIEENGKEIGTNTDEQRANLDARGDVIDAMHDSVRAMVDENASIEDIERTMRDQIKAYEDTLVAAGLTRDEAREYIAALEDIPEEVVTRLEQEGYDDAYRQAKELEDLYASLPRNITTTMSVVGLTGVPGYSAPSAPTNSRPIDLPPLGPQADRSSRGMRRSAVDRSMSGDIVVELTHVTKVGEREIARAVERVSERDGGLRIKTRAGG